MARLKTLGFELNSVTNDLEITQNFFGAIQSTTKRSGTYAYQDNSASESVVYDFKSSATAGAFYFRFYVYITDLPGVITTFCSVLDSGTDNVGLKINTTGTLELWNLEDNAQVGSDSSALSLNTWYCIELKVDCTTIASTAVEARIDGTSFASNTINLADGVMTLELGNITPPENSHDFIFDDIAINDGSGSFQNSWPGFGEVIHLLPDGAGDNTAWTNTYTNVDEVTPNDVTDYIESNTADQIEEVTLAATPASLETADVINCVQVYSRFALSSGTGSDPTFVLRIKSAPSGTVEESSTISPTATTWLSNSVAAPRNPSLTLYDLPGASTTAWTKADLDTAQIGVRETLTDTHFVRVSSLQLIVDHTPTPTVTLNSPADASSDSDTTPLLDFTGTDPEAQDLEYEVNIDTASGFASSSLTEQDKQTTASASNGNFQGGTAGAGESLQAYGQTIVPSSSYVLAKVTFKLTKIGSPVDNLVCTIHSDSETGTTLATSNNVDGSTLGAQADVEFVFPSPASLTSGKTYYLVLERSGANDTTNYYRVAYDASGNLYAGGVGRRRANTVWADIGASSDLYFICYSGSPLLDKLSVTPDATFTNPDVGGDTHPFNSGENIQYQVQAGDALSTGTYYWRVRALDPSGTNTYGAWSSTRSFTVTSVTTIPNKIYKLMQSIKRASYY